MKKIIALILAVLMLVFCVACGNTNGDTADTSDTVETTGKVEEPAKPAEEMLNATLGKFYETLAPTFEMAADDIKFMFVGGYFSDDMSTNKQGEAGKTPVDVEDAAAMFKTVSLITEDSFAKLDDAAIFHHGMNMNTLAASVMHVANAADVDAVAASLRESVGGNEVWMCGFPERYIVIVIDNYVISAYGNNDITTALHTAITETYDNEVVVCNEVFE